jgi:hypothetical protein
VGAQGHRPYPSTPHPHTHQFMVQPGVHISTLVMLSSAVLECQKKQSRTACRASVTLCQVELVGTAPRRAVRLHESCQPLL